MNKRERLSFLLQKYITNTCSKEELEELFRLIDKDENEIQISDELKMLWQSTTKHPQHTDAHWDALYRAMMQSSDLKKKNKKTRSGRSPVWGIAATLFVIGAVALYLYKSKKENSTIAQPVAKTTIDHVPGGNRAVLILGNGTRVVLDAAPNGTIAQQTGVQTTKTADGQLIYTLQDTDPSSTGQLSYNTIETPKGGQYQITMPDGSKVWLNAQSSLKYPTYFSGNERKVELSGEAYFEVKHQKNSPFKVQVNNQLVEVLGTHFNVNSYKDESSVKTTLLEGSVKLSFNNNPNTTILKPGQQSIYHADKFEIKQVDPEETIAWKNGYFAFNKSSLEDIMRQISRWYNVDISYQQNSLKKELFSGTVSRFEKASQVLSILELTGLVNFKIEERRITVMP